MEIPTNPFPGKNNLEKSAVQQELNQKKVQKIERKLPSKFTITPPKEIIKINRDGTPKSRIKLAAMGRCVQDHTRPHSSFQRTHTKTGKKNQTPAVQTPNYTTEEARRNELESINEQATEHGGVGMAGKYLPAKPPGPGGRCRTTTRASFSFPVADGPIRLPAPRSEGGIRAGEGRGGA